MKTSQLKQNKNKFGEFPIGAMGFCELAAE